MDLQLVKTGSDFTGKKKKWVLLLAALGFSSYGAYRFYHSPSILQKRRKISKLLGALVSITEAISYSAETFGVVSKDLKEFLQSDSDQIPNSLKQISKITKSEEFSGSIIRVTQAFTIGILRGHRFGERSNDGGVGSDSSFTDRVMDRLFSTGGSGFASVVVGSFARNLAMAVSSARNSVEESSLNNSTSFQHLGGETPNWVNVICGNKCRELIGDCIQLFVSTAVAVYLDKTMDVNTYDEMFSGLTNPNHETKVTEMLASVCNGAIETLVKTSHQVLTTSSKSDTNLNISDSSCLAINQAEGAIRNEFSLQDGSLSELESRNSFDEDKGSGWVGKVSSTLAEPSNRRLVLDVTGKITFETVRSFLEFFMDKLYDGLKRGVNVVNEAVVERVVEVVRYVAVKSSVIVTVCLSLCLHMLDVSWVQVPA